MKSELTELKSEVALLKTLVKELLAENAALKEKVVDLEARLKKNSQNSSKPPSFEASVLKHVAEAPVKHLDETGFRIGGKTQWCHVASTTEGTYYHVSPKRKSLLECLKGIVVHDHWKPYFQLADVLHALCNAHHLRELNALIERKERWASKMKRFLLFGLALRKHHGEKAIPSEKIEGYLTGYDQIIQQGLSFHDSMAPLVRKSKRGKAARRTGHNLLVRLQNYRDAVLRFLTDPVVPFTNNLAEQDIRMMKCKQKISGGFRTFAGAEQFARIRGFLSTARKQGWNMMAALRKAMMGDELAMGQSI